MLKIYGSCQDKFWPCMAYLLSTPHIFTDFIRQYKIFSSFPMSPSLFEIFCIVLKRIIELLRKKFKEKCLIKNKKKPIQFENRVIICKESITAFSFGSYAFRLISTPTFLYLTKTKKGKEITNLLSKIVLDIHICTYIKSFLKVINAHIVSLSASFFLVFYFFPTISCYIKTKQLFDLSSSYNFMLIYLLYVQINRLHIEYLHAYSILLINITYTYIN